MIRLAVRVRRAEAELVLAELLELAPSGVEEVDLGDVVEYAVYGPPGELPALPDLRAAAGESLVEVGTTEIADDWSQRWRSFHKPLVLPGAITVRPPWAPPGSTPVDLVIDPGQAFGTGAHATTRMCLALMLELVPRGPFVDLGCGSGVLALAAAKLGWDPVIAIDNDPAGVAATAANAEVNGVTLDVRRLDLRTDPLPAAPTAAANLLGPLLRMWAQRMRADAAPGVPVEVPERVIASGLLVLEADGIAQDFVPTGLKKTMTRADGEWAALVLERSP